MLKSAGFYSTACKKQLYIVKTKRLFNTSFSSACNETLHSSAIAGDKDGLVTQLKQGIDVNARDAHGWTPLMLAVRHGHAQIAEILLKHGSDQALHNMTGQTAVDIAQFFRCKEAYDVLKSSVVGVLGNESFIANSSLSTGIDRCSDLRSNTSWLLKTIKRADSVFVAMHDGQPVVTLDETHRYQLVRMNYSQVQKYIKDNLVVFLGLHQERSKRSVKKFRITSETGQNQFSDSNVINKEEKQMNTKSSSISELIMKKSRQMGDVKEKKIAPNKATNINVDATIQSPAYFCIDMTDLPVSELKVIDEKATVLSSLRFISLKGYDDAIMKQARPLLDWHRRHGYCASCASATTLADGGYKRVCLNEQCITHTGAFNTSYPRLDPTVICAVISADREQCLLARKPSFPPGMFSCVAGFVEPGENLEQACVREVEEETGIHVDNVRYHSSQFWPMPSVLMLGFLAYATAEPQTLQVDMSELETAQWFDREQVVQMLTLQHPESLFVPPRQAIAHRLIKAWVVETAF